MFSGKNRAFYILLFVLVALNIIFFLPLIMKFPDFMMDDFQLFYIIDKNPASLILVNAGDILHLAVRPLAYFSFRFDHIALNLSSFQMKAETLLLHLCFVSVFLFFSFDVLSYLKIQINFYKLGLAALILSTHTICVWWIVWIEQRNEILMLLFYIISLYLVFLYIKYNKNYFLFISMPFYILSFLSKQQSLHLPLIIFIILFLFKEKLTKQQIKGLAYFASAGFLLMLAYLVINFFYYESTSLLSYASLWKKPLSAASVAGLAILPLQTDILYNYLLAHKPVAIAAFLVITGFLFFLYYKKTINRKKIITAVLIFGVTFFPVLSAEVTLRIITIQVFFVYLFLAYAVHTTRINSYIIYALLVLLLYFNIDASLKQFNDEKTLNDKRKTAVSDLDTFINSDLTLKQEKTLALCSPLGAFIPYQYYYYKNNSFGKDSTITVSPFGYTFYFKNFYLNELQNSSEILLNAKVKNDTALIQSAADYIKLFKENNLEDFKITSEIKDSTRGYKEIEYTVPANYKSCFEIYYNGKQWIKLK